MSIQLPPNSTGTVVDTVTLSAKDREIIVVGGDGAAGEVVGVAVTAPTETENGLITRPIFRKDGETLSTANLGISGVFTQTFQDSAADGIVWVEAAAFADQASATNGFVIEESDDSADANFTRTVASASVSISTLAIIRAPITARYWRVKYTNGGTGQTSFRLTATASSVPEAAQSDYDTGAGTQLIPLQGLALPASGGAVAGGTATNPIIIDPVGTTAQPVTDNAGSLTVDNATLSVTGGGVESGALRVTLANDSTGVVSVDDNGGALTVDGTVTSNAGTGNFGANITQVGGTSIVTGGTAGTIGVAGIQAHDAADSGNNPVKLGFKSIAHGTNPTAVAANDISQWYANRAGVPWVLGGHPNIVTIRANYTAAQTDTAIVTISTGLKIVVTRVMVTASNANSVNVSVVIGFGTANTPTTTGVVAAHPNIAAGSGFVTGDGSGMLGVGADNEDLRITSSVPTGGSIDVVVSYFTVES